MRAISLRLSQEIEARRSWMVKPSCFHGKIRALENAFVTSSKISHHIEKWRLVESNLKIFQ